MGSIQIRHRVGIGLVCMSVLLGCNHRADQKIANIEHEQRQDDRWFLKYSATCQNLSLEECVGGYGFTLASDGSYSIGPGPQNRTFSGSIDPEELALIKELSTSLEQALIEQSREHCDPLNSEITEPSEKQSVQVSYKHQNQEKLILHSDRSQLCLAGIKSTTGRALQSLLEKLVAEYYPTSFPGNTCTAAITVLENLYSSVKKCETSSDCAYFSDEFQPIQNHSLDFIWVNDCSQIKPLITGNVRLVRENQRSLIFAKKEALQTCKTQALPAHCQGFSTLQPTLQPPSCEAGQCHEANAL